MRGGGEVTGMVDAAKQAVHASGNGDANEGHAHVAFVLRPLLGARPFPVLAGDSCGTRCPTDSYST